jgi:hypothetical protein
MMEKGQNFMGMRGYLKIGWYIKAGQILLTWK